MAKYRIFFLAFGLLVLVYILNYIAEVFHLHWTTWWYDVMLHFISGACAGFAFIFFYFKFFNLSRIDKINAVFSTFIFVFIVGIVWEYYELSRDYTSFSDGIFFVRDTVSDLIIDCCGGFFATLYSFRFFPELSGKIISND